MRKVKIIDGLELNPFGVKAAELQKAINRAFKEVAEENGSIVKTTYLRTNSGDLRTIVVEYDVADGGADYER